MDEQTAERKRLADERIAQRFWFTDPDLLKDPEKQIGDYRVYRDCYWLANDRGWVCFYSLGAKVLGGPGVSPMANPDRELAEAILKGIPAATRLIYLPWVFIPLDYRDLS